MRILQSYLRRSKEINDLILSSSEKQKKPASKILREILTDGISYFYIKNAHLKRIYDFVTTDEEILDEIEHIAKQTGRNVSQCIRLMIREAYGFITSKSLKFIIK